MATSFNFSQFQPNSENQEMVNLQNNVASIEMRLDELQKNASNSDVSVQMANLQKDIDSIQKTADNVAKSGKKEGEQLLQKFNDLKALAKETTNNLSKKIDKVDSLVQANTDRDRINECFLHMDAHRYQLAADVADKMTIDVVKQILEDYCSSDDKSRVNRKQVLSEFIKHMQDGKRRDLFTFLLNSMGEYICYFKDLAL